MEADTIEKAARAVVEANEAYNAVCRYTPFSNWYKGAHSKAYTHIRKSAKHLGALLRASGADYREVLARIDAFRSTRAGSSDFERGDMITAIRAKAQ